MSAYEEVVNIRSCKCCSNEDHYDDEFLIEYMRDIGTNIKFDKIVHQMENIISPSEELMSAYANLCLYMWRYDAIEYFIKLHNAKIFLTLEDDYKKKHWTNKFYVKKN